ncbi:hypothetical protein EXIGLDRAFT_693459, partial [Exidia glandulosa HHB12029]
MAGPTSPDYSAATSRAASIRGYDMNIDETTALLPAAAASGQHGLPLPAAATATEHGGKPDPGMLAKIRQRSKYYVPGISWIPNYSISYLLGDVLSGLTVGCILIPQSISYATSLAHLNPLTGLYSAAIPALVYSVLGSSRHLNVAPEAA